MTMALDQDQYVVSAGASWKAKRSSKRTAILFHGSGIDDRGDALAWFHRKQRSAGSWIEIEVVDIDTSDWPRRKPRRNVDWRAYFRARDRRALHELRLKLEGMKSNSISSGHPERGLRPPPGGFLVSLDGQLLGRIGVRAPGSMNVDVFVRRRADGVSICLCADGTEKFDDNRWMRRRWKWSAKRLRIGQRLRIEVVEPTDLHRGYADGIVESALASEKQIRAAIKKLQADIRADRYDKEAEEMIVWSRNRPDPRRYLRRPIREQ
ncbi:MAG TPA: hypothetical protein VIF57_21060 [Polyangia bacterium]